MTRPPTGAPDVPSRRSATLGGLGVRLVVIFGIQLVFLFVVTILGTAGKGLPELSPKTLAVGLLPVSAAMGLLLACRRLDLSLPVLLVLAAMLRANPFALGGGPDARLATVLAIAAGIGAASALVTWYGRIASSLWTALLAVAYVGVAHAVQPLPLVGAGGWPWPAAVGASLGLLVVGAAALGGAGLVRPPSRPPLLASGSGGIGGLVGAWILATVAVALAAASDGAGAAVKDPLLGYLPPVAAAALSGAYILRGRWGALAAVVCACSGHLVWAFAAGTDLGGTVAQAAIPAAAPIAAIPLCLALDWAIRRRTGESSPTALLA